MTGIFSKICFCCQKESQKDNSKQINQIIPVDAQTPQGRNTGYENNPVDISMISNNGIPDEKKKFDNSDNNPDQSNTNFTSPLPGNYSEFMLVIRTNSIPGPQQNQSVPINELDKSMGIDNKKSNQSSEKSLKSCNSGKQTPSHRALNKKNPKNKHGMNSSTNVNDSKCSTNVLDSKQKIPKNERPKSKKIRNSQQERSSISSGRSEMIFGIDQEDLQQQNDNIFIKDNQNGFINKGSHIIESPNMIIDKDLIRNNHQNVGPNGERIHNGDLTSYSKGKDKKKKKDKNKINSTEIVQESHKKNDVNKEPGSSQHKKSHFKSQFSNEYESNNKKDNFNSNNEDSINLENANYEQKFCMPQLKRLECKDSNYTTSYAINNNKRSMTPPTNNETAKKWGFDDIDSKQRKTKDLNIVTTQISQSPGIRRVNSPDLNPTSPGSNCKKQKILGQNNQFSSGRTFLNNKFTTNNGQVQSSQSNYDFISSRNVVNTPLNQLMPIYNDHSIKNEWRLEISNSSLENQQHNSERPILKFKRQESHGNNLESPKITFKKVQPPKIHVIEDGLDLSYSNKHSSHDQEFQNENGVLEATFDPKAHCNHINDDSHYKKESENTEYVEIDDINNKILESETKNKTMHQQDSSLSGDHNTFIYTYSKSTPLKKIHTADFEQWTKHDGQIHDNNEKKLDKKNVRASIDQKKLDEDNLQDMSTPNFKADKDLNKKSEGKNLEDKKAEKGGILCQSKYDTKTIFHNTKGSYEVTSSKLVSKKDNQVSFKNVDTEFNKKKNKTTFVEKNPEIIETEKKYKNWVQVKDNMQAIQNDLQMERSMLEDFYLTKTKEFMQNTKRTTLFKARTMNDLANIPGSLKNGAPNLEDYEIDKKKFGKSMTIGGKSPQDISQHKELVITRSKLIDNKSKGNFYKTDTIGDSYSLTDLEGDEDSNIKTISRMKGGILDNEKTVVSMVQTNRPDNEENLEEKQTCQSIESLRGYKRETSNSDGLEYPDCRYSDSEDQEHEEEEEDEEDEEDARHGFIELDQDLANLKTELLQLKNSYKRGATN